MVFSFLWSGRGAPAGCCRRAQDPARILALGITLSLSAHAFPADPQAPFATANRSPFLLPLGLPDATGAAILAAGAFSWRSTIEIANTSIYEPSLCDDRCALTVDGETTRLALVARRGFPGGWEATATLPLVHHGGGFLDRVIEGWHDAFGLPNGDRDAYPRDRLAFGYRTGEGGVTVREDVAGLGDMQLGVGRRLGKHFALRGNLKLPTGDAGDLTGSGGTDLALSAHFSSTGNSANAVPAGRLYSHLSAGVVVSEDGDLLPAQRERRVYFGSATVGWRATQHWHLKVQVDAHSAAWESSREHLGDPSAQLVVGAAALVGEDWVLDFAFSEDIVVERSPDIVFHFGVRWQGH